jgi:hypothetical protein
VPLAAVQDVEALAVQLLAAVAMRLPVQLLPVQPRLPAMPARAMALLQPVAEAHNEVEEAAAAVVAAAGVRLPNLPFLKHRKLHWPRLWRNRQP